jgi:hypothetical protein
VRWIGTKRSVCWLRCSRPPNGYANSVTDVPSAWGKLALRALELGVDRCRIRGSQINVRIGVITNSKSHCGEGAHLIHVIHPG